MAHAAIGEEIRKGRRTLAEQHDETSQASNRRLLRALELGGLAYIVLAVILSSLYATKGMTVGILVGGFIAIINFRAMEWFCTGLLKLNRGPQTSPIKFIFKFAFVFLAVALSIWVFKIDVIGLTIGISAIVAAVLSYAGWLMIEQIVLERK